MTTYESTAQSRSDLSESSRAPERDRSARRLAACAEACEGIPTAELESGVILELVAACIRHRGDDRLREILLRMSPPKSAPVRLLPAVAPAPEDADPAAELGSSKTESVAPIPISAVPAPRPARDAGEERRAEASAVRELAEAPPLTAPQKFRMGLRVRISAKGFATMPPTIASPTGVVLGFSSKSPYYVRVIRDGRTSSETFHMDYWEEDPDHRDANESIVAGFRAPFRAGVARPQSAPGAGAVFLSAVPRKPPQEVRG